MCGFALHYGYHDAALPADRDELADMARAMRRRGPDDSGEWRSHCGRVAAVHRRLAIIDPSPGGHQPMRDEARDITLAMNGEIYNYRELRDALIARGSAFQTQSDTEVVLAMYREHGEAMLPRLRGMFALALWDGERRALLLARDGYGIKPLYFADDGWSIRVASQARVLARSPAVDSSRDPAGWAGFFVFGSVPEPFTTYRGVRSVPAGSVVTVDRRGLQAPKRWFSLSQQLARRDAPAAASTLHDAVRDSVAAHLVADVPVGLFLSSGVDSACVLGVSQELGHRDLCALTVGFEEFRGQHRDEVALAVELARRYRVAHHVRTVSAEEFRHDVPALLDAMDQPSIDGVNTWFAAKTARELGLKVALSGVGGDELLGGYPSFHQLPRLRSACALPAAVPGLGALTRRALTPFTHAFGVSPKWAGVLDYGRSLEHAFLLRRALFMPYELVALMGRDAARDGLSRLAPVASLQALLDPRPRSDFARVLVLESATYLRNQLLRDCDWAGMAHSVEVRVPLVDTSLFRALSPWLATRRRAPGKRALAAASPRALPQRVVRRAKTGFEIPLGDWLGQPRDGVRRWAEQVAEAFA